MITISTINKIKNNQEIHVKDLIPELYEDIIELDKDNANKFPTLRLYRNLLSHNNLNVEFTGFDICIDVGLQFLKILKMERNNNSRLKIRKEYQKLHNGMYFRLNKLLEEINSGFKLIGQDIHLTSEYFLKFIYEELITNLSDKKINFDSTKIQNVNENSDPYLKNIKKKYLESNIQNKLEIYSLGFVHKDSPSNESERKKHHLKIHLKILYGEKPHPVYVCVELYNFS